MNLAVNLYVSGVKTLFLLRVLGASQNWRHLRTSQNLRTSPPLSSYLAYFWKVYSMVMKLCTHKENKMVKKLFHNGWNFLLMSSKFWNVCQFFEKYLQFFKLTLREQQKTVYHSVLNFTMPMKFWLTYIIFAILFIRPYNRSIFRKSQKI